MKTKYRIPNTNSMKYKLDEKYKNSMKTKYRTVDEQTRSTSIEKKLDEKYQLNENKSLELNQQCKYLGFGERLTINKTTKSALKNEYFKKGS